VPQGYRGLAIIGSQRTPGRASSAACTITIPQSGTVRVIDQSPPTSWVFSDGSTIDFHIPAQGDARSVYATFFDRYDLGFGTVWVICIGNRAEHATYEVEQDEVFKQFVASGYSADFHPLHNDTDPRQPNVGAEKPKPSGP
jgi:hypothetical protein